jgi:hypothetical protein
VRVRRRVAIDALSVHATQLTLPQTITTRCHNHVFGVFIKLSAAQRKSNDGPGFSPRSVPRPVDGMASHMDVTRRHKMMMITTRGLQALCVYDARHFCHVEPAACDVPGIFVIDRTTKRFFSSWETGLDLNGARFQFLAVSTKLTTAAIVAIAVCD